MQKEFEVVVVDDQPDTVKPVLQAVRLMFELDYNYKINYKVLSKQDEIERLNDYVCDIVMFDCALNGGDYDFRDTDGSRYGYELIKKYREKNTRTKIIFYSGSFVFGDDETFNFTVGDFIHIINELNVFAITNREVPRIVETIKRAIDNLDTVLVSLEDLIYRYGEEGYFYIDGQKISSNKLLNELKLGTKTGEKFREEVYSTIISYFMKFGDENS